MKRQEIGAAVARLLVEAGAVHVSRKQPFILAAGWASPVYVDCRLLLDAPSTRQSVARLAAGYLATTLAGIPFDAIAGAETAGLPVAVSLADHAGLRFRYVRKRPLGIGRNAQVEGGPVDGLKLLLVDDLTTDGSSKIAFARGLRAAGGDVAHVLTIFHHGAFSGADDRLSDAGLTLHAMAGWADLLRSDAYDRFPIQDRAEVERFLADPVAWSTQHGGRTSLSPPA